MFYENQKMMVHMNVIGQKGGNDIWEILKRKNENKILIPNLFRILLYRYIKYYFRDNFPLYRSYLISVEKYYMCKITT